MRARRLVLLLSVVAVAVAIALLALPRGGTDAGEPAAAPGPTRTIEAPARPVDEDAAGTTTPLPDGTELDRGQAAPPIPADALPDVIDQLLVDDEGSPTGGYDRSLFPHWITTDTGCSTREDVLRRDVVGAHLDADGCRPVAGTGTLLSHWDGLVVDDPADIDVDHIVALGDAWGAGASTWTAETRRTFANDPFNLLAVTASSNRAKAAHGPDRWLPASTPEVTCWYLDRYARVRHAYELSLTTAEHAALVRHSAAC